MNIKEQFNQPIHKQDLLVVIKQVIFMSLIGGLLIGSLQLLIVFQFGFDFTWLMLFVLAYITARRIKRSISEGHIIYSLLSVLAFILAYYLMNITVNLGLIYLLTDGLSLSLILPALNPIPFFLFLYPLNGNFFSVNNILEVVFFLIGVYYAFQYSK